MIRPAKVTPPMIVGKEGLCLSNGIFPVILINRNMNTDPKKSLKKVIVSAGIARNLEKTPMVPINAAEVIARIIACVGFGWYMGYHKSRIIVDSLSVK